jgi:hypothetical protein
VLWHESLIHVDQEGSMTNRCLEYLSETTSIEGLIQQVAVSYLRHGYWWFAPFAEPSNDNSVDSAA